jgi:hypothetical protein
MPREFPPPPGLQSPRETPTRVYQQFTKNGPSSRGDRIEGDGTLERCKSVADQVLESIAGVAAGEPGERAHHLTAGFEQILLALFKDTGISQEELRTNLKHRVERHRLERLSTALIQHGTTLD